LNFRNNTRFHDVLHGDEDVISRVAVEGRPKSLLVKVVANEANAATKDEKAIQRANLDVLVCLFPSEGTTVTEQVNKANGYTTVNVEDELDITVRTRAI